MSQVFNEEMLNHLLSVHEGISVRERTSRTGYIEIEIESGDEYVGSNFNFQGALEECLNHACDSHESDCTAMRYDSETGVTDYTCGYECHEWLQSMYANTQG